MNDTEFEAYQRQVEGERLEHGRDQAGQEQQRREWPATDYAEAWPSVKPLNILDALDNPRPPRPFLLRGYIPANVAGLLIGTGATGKSFVALTMGTALASGKTIAPFEPEAPGRVLMLNVEDPAEDIDRRLYSIGQEYSFTAEERRLLNENLIILPGRGQVKPFMDLQSGVPTESAAFGWFTSMVDQYQPRLAILDTKSRLYGLDENSTDHAARWLGLFERLLVTRPEMSFLIISHTSKGGTQREDAHADRGGSSMPDNARMALVLCRPQPADLERLGIRAGEEREYAKLINPKQSYSAEAATVFFRKNPFGVPVKMDVRDPHAEAISAALDRLVEILREDHPEGLNKRALERGKHTDTTKKASREEGCDPYREIKDEIVACSGIAPKHWAEVILLGLGSGRLVQVTDQTSKAKNKPELIRAKDTTEWAEGDRVETVCQTVTSCQKPIFDSLGGGPTETNCQTVTNCQGNHRDS